MTQGEPYNISSMPSSTEYSHDVSFASFMFDSSVDVEAVHVKAANPQDSASVVSINRLSSRENWTGRLDFLLSCIGFAVGLGNIWRFPYLCYKNGGGAFLIPYTFFMITCGMPLFYLEISYGQFASLSPITVWRISPLFRGIGYGMVIICGIVCIYYNAIIAWNFYFLFNTFSTVLPWTLCGQSWNTANCFTQRNASENGSNNKAASAEFWERNVLEMTDGIENFGTVRWPLLGCLLLAWVIVFLCLSKGIKSSGKVVYVTATFPYFVLVILLIRGVTLPGAQEGIKFYVIPKWEKLLDYNVWGDAAVQIFFSVGMAWGSLITMASYNKFDHNVYRDAMVVPLVNCGTSIFAGFVIFSTLGFMSHESGVDIEHVVNQGPGLTFVAYPEAVSKMPFAQLWAVLFFLMIFTVGLDTQFGFFETIISAFIDQYPIVLRRYKVAVTAGTCFAEFLMGVPLVFQGGLYLLEIMDWYAATFSLMLISVFECVVICWIYGVQRFAKDIQMMIGRPPALVWQIMWKYVTPTLVLFTWLFTVGTLEPVKIKSYTFPRWAIYLGWAMGAVSLVPLPICALLSIRREQTGTLWQRVKKLAQPAFNWGPARDLDKIRYYMSMDQFDRERFESSFFNLDRDRYLPLREIDGQGRTLRVNLEAGSTLVPARNYILPAEVAEYFPVLFPHPAKTPDNSENLPTNEDSRKESAVSAGEP